MYYYRGTGLSIFDDDCLQKWRKYATFSTSVWHEHSIGEKIVFVFDQPFFHQWSHTVLSLFVFLNGMSYECLDHTSLGICIHLHFIHISNTHADTMCWVLQCPRMCVVGLGRGVIDDRTSSRSRTFSVGVGWCTRSPQVRSSMGEVGCCVRWSLGTPVMLGGWRLSYLRLFSSLPGS